MVQINDNISDLIVRERAALRMTKKELSERTGLSLPTIRKAERDHTALTFSSLLTILKELGLV